LFELFDKYVDWKVLRCFLACPKALFYASQVAKQLKISPSSANNALKNFAEKGFLVVEEKGFARLYRLNQDNEAVKSLKRAYGIDFVQVARPEERILATDPDALSIALYGSYASGSFDEESDIDFIIITPSKKELYVKLIRELENQSGKEVNLAIFKLSEWRKLAKDEDAFYKNVVSNNVLLYGAGLK
jgi:predicted nucleotidyltransferase